IIRFLDLENLQLQAKGAGGFHYLLQLGPSGCPCCSREDCYSVDPGSSLLQQLQPFSVQCSREHADARDVPTWTCEAGDEPRSHRITSRHDDNRNRLGRLFGGLGRCLTRSNDHVDFALNQVPSEFREPLLLSPRPSDLHGQVPSLYVAK